MKTIQLSLPTVSDFTTNVSRIRERVAVFFSTMDEATGTTIDHTNTAVKMNMRKFKRFFKNSTILPFAIVGIVVLILIVISLRHILTKSATTTTASTSNGRVELRSPLKSQSLNKTFSFPLKDNTGKQVSSLSFIVQNVEIRDQIIIQGKVANATVGKDVLIVNLELTNKYTKPIEINTRNYVRLLKNNDGKLYDPKIHNDPVDVQPISTTDTRVGFTINDTDKDFIIQIGDVTDSTSKTQNIKLTNLN